MTKIRICVCDTHALFREGVKTVLRADPRIEIAGEAADGKDALELINRVEPDIALVAIALPVLRGFEITQRITRDQGKTKVIILTIYEDEDMVARCLDAGAAGYVLKDTSPGQLLYAIDTVYRGERYISPKVLNSVVSYYVKREDRNKTKYDLLSDREREVLILLAEGCAIKEVAARLGLSVKTVDAHRAKLMSKLGLHDRTDLIRYAIRKKLIEA
jgi:DNA-binding NarL/FixJ family response regulator